MAIFPPGTVYFNQEPGHGSTGYVNASEHLGSVLQTDRMLLLESLRDCAVVVWDHPGQARLRSFLRDGLGMPLRTEGVLRIPYEIHLQDQASKTEARLKQWLLSNVPPASLVMMHPYADREMEDLWVYPHGIAETLADKGLMGNYVPQEFLAESRMVPVASVAREMGLQPLPFVAKAPLSSAGDGVRVCLTPQSRTQAASFFEQLGTPVVIQEYVPHVNNVTVYFEVPHDGTPPCLTGFTEQVVTAEGRLVGALVPSTLSPDLKTKIDAALVDTVLPQVREMGWFGLGGMDCLVTSDGRIVLMDPNFRANTSIAVLELQERGVMEGPVLRFRAAGNGIPETEILRMLERCARSDRADRILTVLGIALDGTGFAMDGCLDAREKGPLLEVIRKMESMGLSSPMFGYAKGEHEITRIK